MSFGNIVGQLLQQGMAKQSRSRVEQSLGSRGLGASGAGIEQMLGSLLGAAGGGRGAGAQGGVGALLGAAQSFLGSKQAGNLSGGQIGGLGALAGALLGGGGGAVKGAAGGSAMAMLGALAVNALQSRGATGSMPGAAFAANVPADQMRAATAADTEKLIVKAMISAAKADGTIDQREMERIAGKVGSEGVSPEERTMLLEELQRPLDIGALVAEVSCPVVAAEVYAASLLAIDIETQAEVDYLRDLARRLGLDAATVARLHDLTGAPAIG
jgi:uncharacterized membrane protein YebE (DUF533 family)